MPAGLASSATTCAAATGVARSALARAASLHKKRSCDRQAWFARKRLYAPSPETAHPAERSEKLEDKNVCITVYHARTTSSSSPIALRALRRDAASAAQKEAPKKVAGQKAWTTIVKLRAASSSEEYAALSAAPLVADCHQLEFWSIS